MSTLRSSYMAACGKNALDHRWPWSWSNSGTQVSREENAGLHPHTVQFGIGGLPSPVYSVCSLNRRSTVKTVDVTSKLSRCWHSWDATTTAVSFSAMGERQVVLVADALE